MSGLVVVVGIVTACAGEPGGVSPSGQPASERSYTITAWDVLEVQASETRVDHVVSTELVDIMDVASVVAIARDAGEAATACAALGVGADIAMDLLAPNGTPPRPGLFSDDPTFATCTWSGPVSGAERDPALISVTVGEVPDDMRPLLQDPDNFHAVELEGGQRMWWVQPLAEPGGDSSMLILTDSEVRLHVRVEVSTRVDRFDEVGSAVMASVLEAVG